MARYRGPKSKKARAFGEPIFGFDKAFEKKKYKPGQHGTSRRRRVKSEYALQLLEKQKAKYTYGLLERQFKKTFVEAARRKGVTGEILMQLLEARVDNTVFRLGIASTRRQARQLVLHKHILVNGKVVNIPSFTCRVGDLVEVRESSKALLVIADSLEKNISGFPWLEWNGELMQGKVIAYPEREQIPENIKEQLIVELYSK